MATAKDSLFEEAQKVVGELEKELASDDLLVRVVAGGQVRSVQAQEARQEIKDLEGSAEDLQDKAAETEEWLAGISKRTPTGATSPLSYDDINEGYREIWGEDLPGWGNTSKAERSETLKEADKDKLFSSAEKKIGATERQVKNNNSRIIDLEKEADAADSAVANRRRALERRLSNVPDFDSATELRKPNLLSAS